MSKKILIINNGALYMKELHKQVKKQSNNRAQIDTVHINELKQEKLHDYDAIILSGSSKKNMMI